MTLKPSLLAVLLASAAAACLMPAPAKAGSLDQAQLACYVDTYAFDQLATDFCVSVWTPGGADLESVAVFEVVGLPPGNYTYSWNFACDSSLSCFTSINARWDHVKTAQVTVRNVATGEQRTLSATAEYINGWD
ncbi:MAG: hypothetical protein H4O13_14300 [Xanthomonadales bacterium]|nr:hypothetical protein [Xanthomonadales bacterium]